MGFLNKIRNIIKHNIDVSDSNLDIIIKEIKSECTTNEKVPLINASNNQVEFVFISDIMYFESPRSVTSIYTQNQEYYWKNKDYYLPDLLKEYDCFVSGNRYLFVNINHIKKYNSQLNRVYFTEDVADQIKCGVEVTGKSIKYEFHKILGRENDLSKDYNYSQATMNRC